VFSAAAAARVQFSATIGRFFQQKSRYSVRNAAQGWPAVTSILKSSAASFTLQPYLIVVASSAPRAAHLVAAFSSQTSIAPLRIIIW
jgi:hypothetical protein